MQHIVVFKVSPQETKILNREVTDIDIAIIGGGIIGTSIALELIEQYKNREIVLFEKEKYAGEHCSGRNSGVLHAGLYYPTNSLKHLHCIEGNSLWKQLCNKYQIPYKRCGKYIVSKGKENIDALETLFLHAQNSNKVKNLKWCTSNEIKNLQNQLNIDHGFFSAETGIIDTATALTTLHNELYKNNVNLLFNCLAEVHENTKQGFILKTTHGYIRCQQLINTAGLFAPNLAKNIYKTKFESCYIKGHYLYYNRPLNLNSLIYPLPAKDLSTLGIHLTFDLQNRIKFGPDRIKVTDINYQFEDRVVGTMKNEVKKLFKTIDIDALHVDYCGIRPKIHFHNSKEDFYDDFYIGTPRNHNIANYFELVGIDSPGLTAAPSLAKYIVSLL